MNTNQRVVYVHKMPPKPKEQLFTDWKIVEVPTVVWGMSIPVGTKYRMHESQNFGYIHVSPPINNRSLFQL